MTVTSSAPDGAQTISEVKITGIEIPFEDVLNLSFKILGASLIVGFAAGIVAATIYVLLFKIGAQ